MRQATRITLFIHDRNGKSDMVPDLEVLHLLLEQLPLVTRNPDGSRTFVFDLMNPREMLREGSAQPLGPSLDRLRQFAQALAHEARSLGLPLTAGMAEASELVAEAEVATRSSGRVG